MSIKLDENLGQRVAAAFSAAGHDVAIVFEQRLTSTTDQQLFGVCVRERRLLVSLDTDFANPLRFDPLKSAGIVVLRVHGEPTRSELDDAVQTLLGACICGGRRRWESGAATPPWHGAASAFRSTRYVFAEKFSPDITQAPRLRRSLLLGLFKHVCFDSELHAR